MSMIKTAIVSCVVLVAAHSVALAQSSTCSAAWSDHFCHTGNVPANADNHFIHLDVSGPCDLFAVVDRVNGLTVYQASTGWGRTEKTLGNVFSAYSVYLYGGVWPITNVTISN
jgi:hypothetical protein